MIPPEVCIPMETNGRGIVRGVIVADTKVAAASLCCEPQEGHKSLYKHVNS
jgi:hypothetical protein